MESQLKSANMGVEIARWCTPAMGDDLIAIDQ
jgi:hypothetical protein